MSNFTNKQRLFIEEYLQCWNATEAARQAGYAGSDATLGVVGYENLRKPKIEAIIHQRLAEAAMGADEVLTRLAEQARGLNEDFFTPDGALNMAVVIAKNMTHLVKKTKRTKYGLDVELYDAQAALTQIGRAHGLFKDKVDLTTGGEPLAMPQHFQIALTRAYDGTGQISEDGGEGELPEGSDRELPSG